MYQRELHPEQKRMEELVRDVLDQASDEPDFRRRLHERLPDRFVPYPNMDVDFSDDGIRTVLLYLCDTADSAEVTLRVSVSVECVEKTAPKNRPGLLEKLRRALKGANE